jgi:hypothetical protein
MNDRVKAYSRISTELACLSDVQLSALLDKAAPMHAGIGGKSALMTINDTPVFVKKIALTDLERLPENILSTANLFDLPLCCQYGIRSPGFGAWRELVAHIMTTNWVIAEDCPNFPILYHWRVLPAAQPEPISMDEWGGAENYHAYFDNSLAVRKRVESRNSASFQIVFFLEYIPQTLYKWLGARVSEGGDAAAVAVQFVEKSLEATNDFMISQGFLHCDAHFQNILTDGHLLYLSDFGLALSTKFDLSNEEINFFSAHKTYDRCSAALSLLHSVITNSFGKEKWQLALRDYLKGDRDQLHPVIESAVKRNAPIAQVFDEFYQTLKTTYTTPYPSVELERLLVLKASTTKPVAAKPVL